MQTDFFQSALSVKDLKVFDLDGKTIDFQAKTIGIDLDVNTLLAKKFYAPKVPYRVVYKIKAFHLKVIWIASFLKV